MNYFNLESSLIFVYLYLVQMKMMHFDRNVELQCFVYPVGEHLYSPPRRRVLSLGYPLDHDHIDPQMWQILL